MNILTTLGLSVAVSMGCAITNPQALSTHANAGKTNTETRQKLDKIALSLMDNLSCTDGVRDYAYSEEYISLKESMPSLQYDSTTMTLIDISAYFSNVNGLPATALLAIEAEGNGAKDESENWTSENFITQTNKDSARHFLWAFRSVKNVLATDEETRIFLINYEWANSLIDEHDAYYEIRYNLYHNVMGYDEETSDGAADADADDYVLSLKNSYESTFLNDEDAFYEIFDDANLMDLHNDYIGRTYADNYFWWGNSTKKQAYTDALNNGDICVSTNDIDNSFRHSVYSDLTKWYIG